MIATFRPTRAVSQGHRGRPRRRPGTKARSANPTSRAASGSSMPIRGPARFGATVSAAPMALVTTPTRTAARLAASGVTFPLTGCRALSQSEGSTPTLPCRCARGACSQASSRADAGPPPVPPGSGECGVLGSSSCLASSTQQMNSFRARGVMSLQACSAVGLAMSASRRSPGSLCTTPPGSSRATHGTTRTQHQELRHHLTARIDRSFTHQRLHRPSQHEAHRLQPTVMRPSKQGLSSRACQRRRVHGECEPSRSGVSRGFCQVKGSVLSPPPDPGWRAAQ